MLPLYEDPYFTFRFADARLIPPVPSRRRRSRAAGFGLQDRRCHRRALGPAGDCKRGRRRLVDLTEPIIVRAGEAFIVVLEPHGKL
jgi:hypothetical protein